jgi:hypothetical protein
MLPLSQRPALSNGNEPSQIKRRQPFPRTSEVLLSWQDYDFLFVAPAVGVSFEVIEGSAIPSAKLHRTYF